MWKLRYTEHDDAGLPGGVREMALAEGLTYPQMVAAARLTAKMTGEAVTIVDDEGEEGLTIWPQ